MTDNGNGNASQHKTGSLVYQESKDVTHTS
jgi:hypothetical protein